MKLNNNILFFISLSLGIHLVVLLSFQTKNYLLPAVAGNKLSINLNQQVNKQRVAPANKKTPVKTGKQTDTLAQTIKPAKQTPQGKPATGKPVAQIPKPPPLQKVLTSNNTHSAQAQIISQLKLKLRNSFYYPRLARRRNWQGDVSLIFDVSSKGLIKNVTVSKSSGYNILDKAAVNSLSEIQRINTAPFNPAYHSGLSLNIKYRLEEG